MDIAELKDESRSWNLASDSKLLEYLQQFSAGVTDRTKSFVDKVDNLSFEVAESEVSLKNTFNEFLMLGNSQFIENVTTLNSLASVIADLICKKNVVTQRVYDDDEDDEQDTAADSKFSDGPTYVDPVANLKEAFTLGQSALKLFFFEDSQDDKFEVSFYIMYCDESISHRYHSTFAQDIYNVRPLPYIIGTKSYIDSADAGLGGMGGFEEEPHHDAPAAGGGGSGLHALASQDDDDDSFDQQRGGHHAARTRSTSSDAHHHQPPSRSAPPVRTQSQYDYDDEEVEETLVNDDSTITSHNSSVPPPPQQRPKPSANPLKDMLNAQIANRGGAAPAPAGAKTANQSNWEEDDDEDSTSGPAQKPLAVGKVPPAAPGARRNSDDHSVASGSHQGRAASQQEEEDEEEGDLFADNDDPFKLFGSKPSAFNRVRIFMFALSFFRNISDNDK